MSARIWLAVGLALPLAGSATAGAKAPAASRSAPASTASVRLRALFAADAAAQSRIAPLDTVARGEPSPPGDFALTFTDALIARERAAVEASLAGLEAIDRAALTPSERISYDAFAHDKAVEQQALSPPIIALTRVQPMNHFYGLQVDYPTFVSGADGAPFKTVRDYDENLARTRLLPRVFAQAIARFREGMASGVVGPKLTVRNMLGQIDALLAQPVEESPFYGPIKQLPASFDARTRERLRRDYAAAIADDVYPAYRTLRRFLADNYLPAAREQVGLSAMKGGDMLYRELIRERTTLELDPEAVHQLGLTEVARIHGEMDAIRRQVGFQGTLAQFFDHIRSEPRFHPTAREQLSEAFTEVARKIDAQIPRFFAQVPKTPLRVEAYPAYREKYEAGASYSPGAPDASRPGTFYFNTYDLPSRFLTGVTTLYLHEGIPGHHFQISLAQENRALPAFQRFGGNTAFSEGWALYAETLGYDMGLYDDVWQRWGTLDDEMLRAMRLVVDTGLHAKGWSRDQGIAYMLANSGMGRTDATAEVERYIAIPAQALAYKIGALTIQRLRRKAEAALGSRFDLRAFHAQVLGSGALPLPVLEAKIDGWIAAGGGAG